MVDSKFFGIPFAVSGDKATIPEDTQPSGAISYTQGYGPDYERDPETDPLAKRVPRDETNELYYQITNALRFLQLYGAPEWYAVDDNGDPVSYPLTARVRHDAGAGMQVWCSLIANNTATPGSDPAKWAVVYAPRAAALDVYSIPGTFSWVCPAGVTQVFAKVWGGGGAGGSTSSAANSASASGGGGGYCEGLISVVPGSTYTVVVGAGGVAGSATIEPAIPTPSTDGGTSSFAGVLSATGGGAGFAAAGSIQTATPGGGTGSGGAVNFAGGGGGSAFPVGTGVVVPPGGYTYAVSLQLYAAVSALFNGRTGIAPGGGGGGAYLGGAGGAGGAGRVILQY